MGKVNAEFLSWEDIEKKCEVLAHKIKKNYDPDVLIGMIRGGLPITNILSDILGNKNVLTVCTKYYNGICKTKKEVKVLQAPDKKQVEGKKTLLIDELADTGNSFICAKKHIEGAGAAEIKTAALFIKPWSKFIPDFYIEEKNTWLVFPWDRRENIKLISDKKL